MGFRFLGLGFVGQRVVGFGLLGQRVVGVGLMGQQRVRRRELGLSLMGVGLVGVGLVGFGVGAERKLGERRLATLSAAAVVSPPLNKRVLPLAPPAAGVLGGGRVRRDRRFGRRDASRQRVR